MDILVKHLVDNFVEILVKNLDDNFVKKNVYNLFDNFVSGLYRGYSYHNNISIYEFYKYLLENYIWKNPKVLKETVKYFMTKMKNRVKG